MPTEIGGMQVATTGSNHVSPGPAPAMSLSPPPPPAGPVPAPYIYISRSSSAQGTSSKLTVGGDPVLVIESNMDVEKPGNIIAQSTGADVVTHVADMRATTCSGACSAKADGKKICRTGDSVYMNVPTGTSKVAQTQGILIGAAMLLAMSAADQRKYAAQWLGLIDPVSAATGAVFESDLDLELRGVFSLRFERHYFSLRQELAGPFGRGGWTHSFAQSIEVFADHLVLADANGRERRISTAGLEEGPIVSRAHGLEITRAGERILVHAFDNRRTRTFEPLERGGRAVLRAERDSHGNTAFFDYAAGLLVAARGPSGRELRFAYDAGRRLTRVELWSQGASQQVVDYAYTELSELEVVKDAASHTQRFAYDAHHRLIEKTLPSGLRFHYRYDPETGRCVRGWGDGGIHRASFLYDLEKGTTTLTDTPQPRVVVYDEKGSILVDRTPNGANVCELDYDDDGLAVAERDAAGNEQTIEHDAMGNVVRVSGPGAYEGSFEYDERRRLVRRTLPGGQVTEFTYDAHGALTGVVYPSGVWLALSYDGRGRVSSVAGADGNLASFDYDDQDNVVVERGPFGEATSYAYDPLGRVLSRTDALGRTMTMAYDAVGRKIEHRAPDGGVTTTAYDPLGLPAKIVDVNGGVLEQVFAGVHSLVKQKQADGQEWEFEYDAMERVRAIVNAKRERWEIKYDRAGRVVEERPFDGRVLRFQWGTNGALTKIEHNDGTTRLFTTDQQGRRLVDWSEHSVVEMERDVLGRCVKATLTEPLGTFVTELTYDALGRVASETQDGRTIRYEYGPRNQPSARVLPNGQTTRYAYDIHGRIKGVEHEGRLVSFTRDAIGREVSRRWEPCFVDIASTYDVCDRLLATTVTRQPRFPGDARPIVLERNFSWDKKGWLLRVDDSHEHLVRYEHDELGQLLQAQAPEQREVFRYDVAGSVVGRLERDDTAFEPWKVLPGNVLVGTDEATYEVDEERRRRKRVDAKTGEVTEYLWDCRSRLREVRFANGERVIYAYDAFGRRVRKDRHEKLPDLASGAREMPRVRSTRFLWSGDFLVAEIDEDGRERIFVHEPGSYAPVMQQEGSEVLAFVVDHLGTPKELLDESGAIAWRATHSAFGVPTDAEGSRVSTPFGLLGHFRDRETGFAYARNRYFDATTARWLSPDPFGFLGGRNLQAFNGNPTVHVDPFGLYCAVGNPAWDGAFRSCPAIPPKPGYYDVIIHGDPTSGYTQDPHGNWPQMSTQDLANLIKAQTDYVPGTPIRLVSCQSGRNPDGFAQDLADQMGVGVLAPTRTVTPAPGYVGPGGSEPGLLVWGRDDTPASGFIPNDAGTWVPFSPR